MTKILLKIGIPDDPCLNARVAPSGFVPSENPLIRCIPICYGTCSVCDPGVKLHHNLMAGRGTDTAKARAQAEQKKQQEPKGKGSAKGSSKGSDKQSLANTRKGKG